MLGKIFAAIFSVAVLSAAVGLIVWFVYFWYRVAVTVNAWPFG